MGVTSGERFQGSTDMLKFRRNLEFFQWFWSGGCFFSHILETRVGPSPRSPPNPVMFTYSCRSCRVWAGSNINMYSTCFHEISWCQKRLVVIFAAGIFHKIGSKLVVPRCARNAENLCSCMCHTRARFRDRGRLRAPLYAARPRVHHTLETPCVLAQCGYRFLEE